MPIFLNYTTLNEVVNLLKSENINNIIMFTTTTLAPVGVEYKYEIKIPDIKENTDTIDENIITILKLLKTFMEITDGNTIKLDIRSAPTSRIPKTIVIAVRKAINIL